MQVDSTNPCQLSLFSAQEKRCPKCGCVKPYSEFYRRAASKDGCSGYCKSCQREYIRANKTRVYESNRASWHRNREARLAYKEAHLERDRATGQAWTERNRAKRVEYEMRRKARKRGASDQEKYGRQEVFERDGWVCQLCNQPVNPDTTVLREKPTIDHIMPLSKGGPDTLSNVQLAHWSCNMRKGVKIVA